MDTLEWLEQPAPKLNNMLIVTLVGDTNSHSYLESSAQIVREEVKNAMLKLSA